MWANQFGPVVLMVDRRKITVQEFQYALRVICILTHLREIPFNQEYFLEDGGGIGRVITFSSTNSLKEQQNGEQSLQNNFRSLAADIRRPEKQPIVFEGR